MPNYSSHVRQRSLCQQLAVMLLIELSTNEESLFFLLIHLLHFAGQFHKLALCDVTRVSEHLFKQVALS